MTILILAEESACHVGGGAARTLREDAIGLKKRGHHVVLLVRAPLTDPNPQAVFNDIPEFRYAVCRKSAPAFVLSSIIKSTRVFDYIAAQLFRPDVVIIHQSLAGFGPLLFRRKHTPLWVYQCHSLAHEEYLTRNTPPPGIWARLLYVLQVKMRFWIEHWAMHRSSRVIIESQFMNDRISSQHHIPPQKISLIPAATNMAHFKPCPDRKSLRVRLHLPEDRIILFSVRNLIPRMGLENLIKAIAEIERPNADLLVIIGGDGPLRPSLDQLVRSLRLDSRVILKGFIPENELAAWYQCADLVVMPTYTLEGFGLVTIEALACGTPVLGTPVGATPEILAPVDPRLLSKGNDAHSIAEALTNILALMRRDPIEWSNLSRKGLQRAQEIYNYEKRFARLDAILAGRH